MRYYVTLFDSNYLTRGLVLYQSLLRHAGAFHLWIICFDELAYQLLDRLNLSQVTLVSLAQFEDEALLTIKAERSPKEYCWSCTPSTLLYVLNTEPQVDAITYLDADLMFFSSPEPIFAEAGAASILLTEHRYLPEMQARALIRGIYNVQFMMFRRDDVGLTALNWWRDRCLEWCFDRVEDGKFGDQKYLDDWTTRFSGVHVVQHLGAGLAPWNAAQYDLSKGIPSLMVEQVPLIFYHFHGVTFHRFNLGYLRGGYPITATLRDWIYRPYFREIAQMHQTVMAIAPDFQPTGAAPAPVEPSAILRFLTFLFREIWQAQFFTRFFTLPL